MMQILNGIDIPEDTGIVGLDFADRESIQQAARAFVSAQLKQSFQMLAAECNRIPAMPATHGGRDLCIRLNSFGQPPNRLRSHPWHVGQGNQPGARIARVLQGMDERCSHSFAGVRTYFYLAAG